MPGEKDVTKRERGQEDRGAPEVRAHHAGQRTVRSTPQLEPQGEQPFEQCRADVKVDRAASNVHEIGAQRPQQKVENDDNEQPDG